MLWMLVIMDLYVAVAALVIIALLCTSRGRYVKPGTYEASKVPTAPASSSQPKDELSLQKTQDPCESTENNPLKTPVAARKYPSSKHSNSNETPAGESKKNSERKKPKSNDKSYKVQKTQISVDDAPPRSKPSPKPLNKKLRRHKASKPKLSIVKTAVMAPPVDSDGFQNQEEEEESATLKSVKSIVNERTSDDVRHIVH
ncbi:hypothetical protein Aduo_015009 [Ancylostoma duodenale]